MPSHGLLFKSTVKIVTLPNMARTSSKHHLEVLSKLFFLLALIMFLLTAASYNCHNNMNLTKQLEGP